MIWYLIALIFIGGGSFAQNSEKQLSELTSLAAYRKGHYRGVVEIFETGKEQADTLNKQYIWASSYVDLREDQKAFDQFNKIDAERLQKSEYSYLYPFYVRKYIQTLLRLYDQKITNSYDINHLIFLVNKVPKNSPVRPYLDREFMSVLWENSNFVAIEFLSTNLSDEGKAWKELSRFERGEAYDAQTIIDSQDFFKKNMIYTNFITTLNPKNYKKKEDITNILAMAQRSASRDVAKKFLSRYIALFKDKEYPLLVEAQILSSEGMATDAARFLYEQIKKDPDFSVDFYSYAYGQLVRRKQFEMADEIAVLALKKHKNKFFFTVRGGVETSNDAQFLLSWYKNNARTLLPDYHTQTLRALIRTDLKKAEEASDIGISYNQDHPEFILVRGLLKEHFGKKEEAYRAYLDLIFKNAFGYSGIVAKSKEKFMREEFRTIFDKVVAEKIRELPKLNLQDRLMLNKSFLVDKELAQYVNQDKLTKDEKVFHTKVLKDLDSMPDLDLLENYPAELSNFAPETQDYIENTVIEATKNSKDKNNDIARYYYKYRKLFKDSEIEGYLTFRLYFYIRDYAGYSYSPIFPRDVVNLVYPKPEFDKILEWSENDKNLAYWMLGSFMAESHFRKRVASSVGAVGFAQVMPYTADDIKKWLKMPHLSNYDFFDNLRMGVYYHKKMYHDMGDDVILSLAAYNAGPTAVNRWKREYSEIKDPYLFIEAINYKETRNYVKVIIYNNGMYHLLDSENL